MADWFRSWHGAPTDNKWLLIARNADTSPVIVSAVVWALLDHASQHVERGTVTDFDVETYAVFAGLEVAQVQAVLDALTEKGVIEGGRLSQWEKRQPRREDNSADRVRAYRERQQAVTPEPERPATPGNDVKRDVTQRNAPEERRGDTETDTETETEPAAAAACVREAAEILGTAAWVGDDSGGVERGITRSLELVPGFAASDAPLEAEKFVRWHSGAGRKKRKPPEDWYRAWLNWIKRARTDRETTHRNHDTGRYSDPAAEQPVEFVGVRHRISDG